jgi:reductive dehalogenase
MKMLELEQAKAGATIFHDLDEVIASPTAAWKRPWWVRWVDKPTVEIDWDNMQRFDGRKMQQVSWAKYVGEDVAKRLTQLRDKRMKQWILENKSGYTLRDRAMLLAGAQAGSVGTSFLGFWRGSSEMSRLQTPESSTGTYVQVKDPFQPRPLSPEEWGIPRWQGSPEENARMIQAVMRHFGADQVGFLELDEHIRKLVYSFDARDGKALEFEDVDQAYETDNKRVIPERARWVIVFSVQMSDELIKRYAGKAPTALSSSTVGLAYAQGRNISDRLQTFLYVLGYQGLMGTWYNGLAIAPALGVMAGLGELSRLNKLISPEYGPLQRIFKVITDLPLTSTKPIDAGIMRFCRTCKKCAEACPAKALSMETEPSWEVVGPWNNPGHRAYFQDGPRCRNWWSVSTVGCSTCLAVCPFSRKDKSFVHKLVQPTLSLTPLLNGFFTRMHTFFGYGQAREPESWWELNLPPHGINSVRGTQLE